MDAGTQAANAIVEEYLTDYDAGTLEFYDSAETLLGVAYLSVPAFKEPTQGRATLRHTPLRVYPESSVSAEADHAIVRKDDQSERIPVTTGSTGVVLSQLLIEDGGATVTVDDWFVERGDRDPSIDRVGSVALLRPAETLTEGGAGYWKAEVTYGDLGAEKVELQESTDGGSTWTVVDTDDYEGKEGRRTYFDGVWTVAAAATHVRARFVDVGGNEAFSSQKALTTEAPAATFATLADLLAADPTTFSPGDSVIVSGEEAHGQEFVLSEDGTATDHCTVYVADADQSAEQTETFDLDNPTTALAQTDIVAGTLTMEYGTTADEYIDGVEMHGFGNDGESAKPMFSYGSGEFSGRLDGLESLRSNTDNPRSSDELFRYKYATSDRRWKRKHYGTIDVRWAGANLDTDDVSTAEDNSHAYNWCVIAAREWYKTHDREWAYVDIPGVLYHLFSRAHAGGVMPRGTGSDMDVPEVGWAVRGGFAMPSGIALWSIDTTHTETRQQFNTNASNAARWGSYLGSLGAGLDDENTLVDKVGGGRRIVYDGNMGGNGQVWTNSGDYNDLTNKLQNGRYWTGLANQHVTSSGYYVKHGCRFAFQYGHVTKMGSDQLQPRTGNWSPSHDIVLTGGGAGDHATYSLPCTPGVPIKNLTLTGLNSIGAGLQLYQSDLRTVAISSLESNPRGAATDKIVAHRTPGDYPGNTSDDYRRGNRLEIDGISIDLTGAPTYSSSHTYTIYNLKTGQTFGAEVTRGRVILTDAAKDHTLIDSLDGSEDVVVENQLIVDPSTDVFQYFGRGQTIGEVVVRSVRHVAPDPTRNLGGEPLFFFKERNTSRVSHASFEDIVIGPDHDSLVRYEDSDSGALPMNAFFSGCEFSTTSDLIEDPPGGGRSSSGTIYLHDTLVPTHGGDFSDLHLDHVGVRHVYDQDGRTSDADGTYRSDASDEGHSFVRIPTTLIYPAQETNVTLESAPSGMTVDSTAYVQSDGTALGTDKRDPYLEVSLSQAIGADEQVVLSWDAHVTPTDRFQPEGAFIARDISDQDYLTGDGSTTFDLNGHVASMETGNQPSYSASSSDTSIVTASVDSNNVLTLTEQGTAGSAVVTIASTISGVGEVQKDVAVTVHDSAPQILTNISASPSGAYSATQKLGPDHDYAYVAEELGGNTTQQIGFDADGVVDTTALANFGGSNQVVINTFRDATTNRNDMTMQGQRPVVYGGSSVITHKGLPHWSWHKGNGSATADTGIAAAYPLSLYIIARVGGSDNSRIINVKNSSTSLGLWIDGSNNLKWIQDNASNVLIKSGVFHDPVLTSLRAADASTGAAKYNSDPEISYDPGDLDGTVHLANSEVPWTMSGNAFFVFESDVSDADDQQIRDDTNLTYNLVGSGSLY